MKCSKGAMPLLALLVVMPAFGAAPIIRSAVQVPPQAEVERTVGSTAESRLTQLEQRMQALTDILMRLDRIQHEVQQLRGEVELQGHSLASLKRRQRDLYGDIDRRLMQLTAKQPPAAGLSAPSYSAAPVTEVPALPSTTVAGTAMPNAHLSQHASPSLLRDRPPLASPPGAALPVTHQQNGVPVKAISTPSSAATTSIVTPTPVARTGADPALEQPMYKQAFDLLKQRRYDEAKQAFRLFLQQYPNGRLAANAQYWVGETSYVTRDFVTALDEFTKVVQNYSTSTKVSDSLLKIAFIQYEQKEWVKSRKTLEMLVKNHSSTTAARLAHKRLERMRIEGN